MPQNLTQACADLLYTEARRLDQRDWDGWLDLYLPEATFWIPMWDTEYELTTDPQSQLSLMWYGDRSGLEDRVFRIRTGMSSASVPLPRTSHLVGNVQASEQANGDFAVTASWQVTYYKHKITNFFAGHYEYTLRPQDDGSLRIARKKIIVINDLIPQVLDFYHI
jgi:3-phenylpropionate/cinnamic acid dioxygenase small subunit